MKFAVSKLPWTHHGLLFTPPTQYHWAQSYAQCPVIDPKPLADGHYRIYFSSRDLKGKSRIGSALFCATTMTVQLEHEAPCLDLAPAGRFDDAGVMPACVVHTEQGSKLMYIGWMERKSVPYQNAIGLASIDENGLLTRDYPGPVLSTWADEAYFTGTIHVHPHDTHYQAYYLSCTEWQGEPGRYEPRYDLKMARSDDLVSWQRLAKPALSFASALEGGYASAAVVKLKQGYLMFYCLRASEHYRTDSKHSYKLYVAKSKDTLNWEKIPGSLFDKLPDFATQMQCYPQFLQLQNRLLLFYNGDCFGRDGFGCSSLSLDDLESLWLL